MGLSCYCDDADDYWYIPDDDYKALATKRQRKCPSCGDKIIPGDLSLRLFRYRAAAHYVEERIYGDWGDGVPMADQYWCERCADLYLSLDELGFCVNCGDDLRELVKEYAENYGPEARRAALAEIGAGK